MSEIQDRLDKLDEAKKGPAPKLSALAGAAGGLRKKSGGRLMPWLAAALAIVVGAWGVKALRTAYVKNAQAPAPASVPQIAPLAARLEEATALLRANAGEKAEQAFALLAKEAPENPYIQANWGMAALALGKPEDAITRLSRAVELAPDHGLIRAALGTAYLEAARASEAEETLVQAVEKDPDCRECRVRLAYVKELSGKWEEAVTQYSAYLGLGSRVTASAAAAAPANAAPAASAPGAAPGGQTPVGQSQPGPTPSAQNQPGGAPVAATPIEIPGLQERVRRLRSLAAFEIRQREESGGLAR